MSKYNSRFEFNKEFCQSKSIKQSSFQVATSNVLVDRMKRSERDVIKEWLENIFKTWERTNDLAIKEFKLTQLNHESPAVENGGILRQNGGPTPAPVSNGGRNGGGGTQQGQEARDQDRLVSETSESRETQTWLTGPTPSSYSVSQTHSFGLLLSNIDIVQTPLG